MDKTEQLAKKISEKLNGLCPAFSDSNAQTRVWHGCHCGVTDNNCVCVHQLTSECSGGKWKQLSFVDKYHEVEKKKSNILLDAVIATRDA